MYDLNDFCNIIASLRKKKGWTQTKFADQLGMLPQSISKWECGIGYPDVTLFPVIAEVLSVPIGVLFGEKPEEKGEKTSMQQTQHITEYNAEFDICQDITVFLGNICRVEIIEGERERCRVTATGDSVFLHYFDVEKENEKLIVNIKNPTASQTHWESYDRCGYDGENCVQIFTGCIKDAVNIRFLNYLDLHAISRKENLQGNFEVCAVGMLS